jgi:hypothetical protein
MDEENLYIDSSVYSLSISDPTKETPSLNDATAVEPKPEKGSTTNKSSLNPCSFIHISDNLIGIQLRTYMLMLLILDLSVI